MSTVGSLGWRKCWISLTLGFYSDHLSILSSKFLLIYLKLTSKGLKMIIFFQIVILAMTTNERMNLARYSHFHTSRRGFYDSPFNRGYWQNLVDFAEFRCLGFLRPIKDDWYNSYDTDDFVGRVKSTRPFQQKSQSCCHKDEDREPLLTVWSTGKILLYSNFRKGLKLRFLRNASTASSLIKLGSDSIVLDFFVSSDQIFQLILSPQYFSHFLWRKMSQQLKKIFHCIFL